MAFSGNTIIMYCHYLCFTFCRSVRLCISLSAARSFVPSTGSSITWPVSSSAQWILQPWVYLSHCRSILGSAHNSNCPSMGPFCGWIRQPVNPSIHSDLQIHQPVGQSISPKVCPSADPSAHGSIHLLTNSPVCDSVRLSVGLSVHPWVSISICKSTSLTGRSTRLSVVLVENLANAQHIAPPTSSHLLRLSCHCLKTDQWRIGACCIKLTRWRSDTLFLCLPDWQVLLVINYQSYHTNH